MAEMARAVDAPVEVEFEGKKYKLRQITNDDYGELERYLKTLYIGQVAKSLSIAGISEDKIIEAVQRIQLEEWARKGETADERVKIYNEKVRPLMESNDAITYILYLALRKEQPELTLDQTRTIISANTDRADDLIIYAMGGTIGAKVKNPKEKAKTK